MAERPRTNQNDNNNNNGDRVTTQLGHGCVVHAPANLKVVDVTDVAPLALARGFTEESFDFALGAAGLARRSVAVVEPDGSRGLAAATPTAPADLTLDVDQDENQAAVVQVEHEDGSVEWFIDNAAGDRTRALTPATTARTAQFTIPASALVPRPAPGSRGLIGSIGSIGKKLLKVFVFPIIDTIEDRAGDIVAGFVRRWEKKARPYYTRDYTPETYSLAAGELQPDQWQRLAEGRALLFIHGTFSSSDAFRSIAPDVMRELSRRYGGRLFAFNHPTMGDDPKQNAKVFLDSIPSAVRSLDVDIVCHSRGGLVSREVANQGDARGIKVKRIVFVAATNAGTMLANEKNILGLVNRYSTIAKLFPNTVTRTIVDGLVVVLKVAARALLEDMVGLAAMDPNGDYMSEANTSAVKAEELYGIASNFEPPAGSPLISVTRAEDATIDAVFANAANDLVVPTDGVANCAAPGFTIPSDRQFVFDASASVMHTHFFGVADTQKKLQDWLEPTASRDLAFARGGDLTGAELQALRPYIVTLRDGKFATSGRVSTSERDVDEMFKQIAAFSDTLEPNAPLRIAVWAHGGLINEQEGLAIAQKHVEWWIANKVYPIYFVWETGLYDALGGILAHAGGASRDLAARGLTDFTDGVVEGLARRLRGDAIWGEMKANASRCSAPGNGAYRVAEKLKAFVASSRRPVELNAIGHSAGSIFHSYFLPAAKTVGMQNFRTLQLLAPAITSREFKDRLAPLVGDSISKLSMYSMHDERERADTCMGVYHKSLLYLIYHSLEPREKEPILGLEMCVDNDDNLRAMFARSDVEGLWSVTSTTTGANATCSTSHGGFDDDPATMTSVGMRVLAGDAGRVKPYQGDARRGREWTLSHDLEATIRGSAAAPAKSAATLDPAAAGAPAALPAGPVTGRRAALCIGIDRYPAPNTLTGCENDARAWGSLFKEQLGFQEVQFLINGDATRDRISSALRQLVTTARAGDVLAVHYSGHGTSLPDDDGDEEDGTDEALVPIDFGDGQFLTDDDLRGIFRELTPGASLTAFIDCCHSGTITRVLARTSSGAGRGTARYIALAPNSDAVQHHLSRRREERASGRTRAFVDRTALRWVNFSACDATELAYEKNGGGAFTTIATGLLRKSADMTNAELQRAVVQAFGTNRAQTPQLDCPPAAEQWPLMRMGQGAQPQAPTADNRIADSRTTGDRRAGDSPVQDRYGRRAGPRREGELSRVADALRDAADLIEHASD